jgi:hypothetical protein
MFTLLILIVASIASALWTLRTERKRESPPRYSDRDWVGA